jgi:hypothetical protein
MQGSGVQVALTQSFRQILALLFGITKNQTGFRLVMGYYAIQHLGTLLLLNLDKQLINIRRIKRGLHPDIHRALLHCAANLLNAFRISGR